ncbi:MAG TPA: hypothetical protein VGI74_00595 [Streptosporangiaceae bacterium]
MNAKQRAAQVAAEIQRSRSSADVARGVTLSELGVRVKGNEVRGSGFRGALAGACAGVMDVKPPSGGAILSSIVIGNVPRVGTILVAFADGTRHEMPLRQGSPAQMRKVDAAIARFNAMADAADPNAKAIGPTKTRQEQDREKLQQAREFHKSLGLTYRECKPGRDAYKLREGAAPPTFQAGHEGPIPFARSEPGLRML